MVDGFVVHATFLLRIQRSITGKNFARKIEDKNLSWAIIRGEKTESSMGKCGCQNALNAKTEEESCLHDKHTVVDKQEIRKQQQYP
jgi:hypothetical protein